MSPMMVITCPRCGTKNRVSSERIGEHPPCGNCHELLPVDKAFPCTVNDRDFAREVLASTLPALVEFQSPRCPYCRMFFPTVQEIAAQYAGRIKTAAINVDENPATSSAYGIQGTPTLILFRNGNTVKRMVGVLAKADIERTLNSIL